MPALPLVDLLAFTAFIVLWVGHTVMAEHRTLSGKSLSARDDAPPVHLVFRDLPFTGHAGLVAFEVKVVLLASVFVYTCAVRQADGR